MRARTTGLTAALIALTAAGAAGAQIAPPQLLALSALRPTSPSWGLDLAPPLHDVHPASDRGGASGEDWTRGERWARATVPSLFGARRIGPVTWAGLGLGAAVLGVTAVFRGLQSAADAEGARLTYQGRGNLAPTSDLLGASYSNIADLAMRAGMQVVGMSVLQFLIAPHGDRPINYARTFVARFEGGWVLGVVGAI